MAMDIKTKRILQKTQISLKHRALRHLKL
jgi:hypothetical protein